jgi:DNA helicase-2/ATP-dependent DNA helicase PcrA
MPTPLADLLAQLNDAQRTAVLHDTGPAVVMAGAGSGKTRVLTTRVARLLEQGTEPDRIALVTFTNKAAQEMNRRVVEYTGHSLPFAGTFHRLGARLLRQHAASVGLDPGFTIYDSDDQLVLIKQIMKTLGISPKDMHHNAIKHAISQAKSDLVTPTELAETAVSRPSEIAARVYKSYQRALQDQQGVDFDDLLTLSVKLLQENDHLRQHYQERFLYVLVDEYQDTNKAQYYLTKLLSAPQENLFVVGDFAQSIYAWRGADYHNMLNLQEDFPGISEYRLEQNYRSTQTILDAATAVISQNQSHPILTLWTDQPHAAPLELIEAADSEDEAEEVLRRALSHNDEVPLSEIVILYRTNAQSRPFEESLVRRGIPYRVVGGFKFYERKEIKDLLAYLRLVTNPKDTVSRQRAEKVGKRRLDAFERWRDTLGEGDRSPQELLTGIIKATDFKNLFDEHDPEDQARIENVDELLAVAAHFEHLPTFLENVALVQDETLSDAPEQRSPHNVLTLMSLHSAKGLEFSIVCMVGLEEGLLPHSRSHMDLAQLEEERRLCYVGMTRAKQHLYLSYARQRFMYGTRTYSLRSRFLNDVPTHLLKSPQGRGLGAYGGRASAAPPAEPRRRTLISDDDLDAVLLGEVDIQTFLRK